MIEMKVRKGQRFVQGHPAPEQGLEPEVILSLCSLSRPKFQGQTGLAIQRNLTNPHLTYELFLPPKFWVR